MPDDEDALRALAYGIIPADERDAGAGTVDAGRRLAERVAFNPVYQAGLESARALAQATYGRGISELTQVEIRDVLDALRERAPAFFKQLRLEVSALYLTDPRVSEAIGFPGPSLEKGGYPDFDRPQG